MKCKIKLLPILFIILLNVKYVYPQNEFLDPTFGYKGIVKTAINTLDSENVSNSVVFQSDGKIVAAGFYTNFNSYKNFALVRYNPDGSLDYSFGTNGIVTTPIGDGDNEINSLAIQINPENSSEEKIIAAGYANVQGQGSNFAMARYNSDGSLDNTFGTDGNGTVITKVSFLDDVARSVVIQNDGKIILSGYAKDDDNYDLVIARYNNDGSIDESFGTENGIVKLDVSGNGLNDYAYAAAVQDDGKVIIAGSVSTVITGQIVHFVSNFALVRYNTDGTLDTDFGANGTGIVIASSSSDLNYANSVAVQKDDKIVIGGTSYNGNDYDFSLQRYTSDGILDNTFNNNGMVITPVGSGDNQIKSIALQQMDDGTESILASGFYFNDNDFDFVIERYNSNGELESSFGSSSEHIIHGNGVNIGESNNKALSMAVKKNPVSGNVEKIILAGNAFNGTNNDFALAGFNLDGTLDTQFGTNGTLTTKIGKVESEIRALALQSIGNDEKIIAAGFTVNSNDQQNFALVRYNNDGTPDSSFGMDGNGFVITPVSPNGKIFAMAIQNDGKIIAGGPIGPPSQIDLGFRLIRYNSDGTQDSSFGNNGNGLVKSPIAIYSTLIQDDGKIVIAGIINQNNNYDFAVARYNSDGTLDNTFGLEKNGIAFTVIKPQKRAEVYSVAIQRDAKIIVAGRYEVSNNDYDLALVRFNNDGTLDNFFGEKGIVTTKIDTSFDDGYSVAVQNDSKIVFGGCSFIGNDFDVALVRYNTDGSLDNSFGKNGIVTTPQAGTNEIITSIKIQGENGVEKINAAGYITFSSLNKSEFILARYNSDGAIDSSFGTNGKIITPVSPGGVDIMNSTILQKDGKIIAGGYSAFNNKIVFALARYNSFKITGIENQVSQEIPSSFLLEQNYPNPFNPSTNIKFVIPKSSFVNLKVYDILGREIATLVNEEKTAGNYKVTFDAKNLASGIYFYRLKAGNYLSVKKMILLR